MNVGKFGRTDLHTSCRCEEELHTAKKLIEQYPDAIHTKDNHGFSPLYHACIFGHTGIIQLLLDRGADVNATDLGRLSPLTIACEKGHAAAVDMLLRSSSCNVLHQDYIGRTPWDWAEAKGREDVLTVLKRHNTRSRIANDKPTGYNSGSDESPNGITFRGSTKDNSSAGRASPPLAERLSAATIVAQSDASTADEPCQTNQSAGYFKMGISQMVSLLGSGIALSDPTRFE